MYKKDVPPVFEPEERFLSILKGNRMRPATVGAQGASIFASILVDNDGIASVIAFVEYFVLAQVDDNGKDTLVERQLQPVRHLLHVGFVGQMVTQLLQHHVALFLVVNLSQNLTDSPLSFL